MLLSGKKALIVGLANDRSLAWGITQAFAAEGCEIALTYQNEVLEKRVRPLAQQIGAKAVIHCDVADDAQIDALYTELEKVWPKFDILVHSVAYAPREALEGAFTEVTTREAFRIALDVSCYSLIALLQRGRRMLNENASAVTLTYYGGEKVIGNYNVMGVAKAALESAVRYLAADLGPQSIRVNAISAGPVRTLAASGVSGIRDAIHAQEEESPLRRKISPEDVGKAALYLCSSLAENVTGEVVHVDAGHSIIGH